MMGTLAVKGLKIVLKGTIFVKLTGERSSAIDADLHANARI